MDSLRIGSLALLFGAASAFIATQASAQNVQYGAMCTQTYTDPAKHPDRRDAFLGCRNFLNRMDVIGTERLYFTTAYGEHHLLGTRSSFEQRIEDLDILYVSGHTGAWSRSDGANIVGHHSDDRSFSKHWRLGDGFDDDGSDADQHGLSVLAVHGCTLLAPYPITEGQSPEVEWADDCDDCVWPAGHEMHFDAGEEIWARWAPTMRGGLRMIVSSWDSMSSTAGQGDRFGRYLAEGKTIAEAWRRASLEVNVGNTPAAFTMEDTEAECWTRLDTMKVTNLTSYERITNSEVDNGHWCMRYWW